MGGFAGAEDAIESRAEAAAQIAAVHVAEMKNIAIAAEPRWVEVSRKELRLRYYALSALLGRVADKKNTGSPILSMEETALLEGLWEMLKDLLG